MASKQISEARAAARKVLTKFGAKMAPVPVEKIAKSLGAEVRFSPLDNELSGMIYIKEGVPIIGVNSLHHPNRQRFTIAHETGHLVLHKPLIAREVHVDKSFPVLMRGITASLGTDRTEIDANDFAAELLIPEQLLKEALANVTFDIDDEQPMERLAKKFRVSRQMLEYRIANLRG